MNLAQIKSQAQKTLFESVSESAHGITYTKPNSPELIRLAQNCLKLVTLLEIADRMISEMNADWKKTVKEAGLE